MALLADGDAAAAATTTSVSDSICRLLDFNWLFGPPVAAPQPPPCSAAAAAAILVHPHSSLSSSSSASSNSIPPTFSSSSSEHSSTSTTSSSADSAVTQQETSPTHDDVSDPQLLAMHIMDGVHVPAASSFGDAAFLERVFELIDVDKNGRVSVNEMRCFLQKLGLLEPPTTSCSSSLDGLSSVFRSFIVDCPPDLEGSTAVNEDALDVDMSEFQGMYEWLFSQRNGKGVEVGSRGVQKPKLAVETERRSQWTSSSKAEAEAEKKNWDEIEEAFRVYDKDGNGYISASELATVLKQLHLLPPPTNHIDDDPDSIKACQRLIDRLDTNGDGFIDIREFRSMLLLHDHTSTSTSLPPQEGPNTTSTSTLTTATMHHTNLLRALTRALPALLASFLSANMRRLLKHFSPSSAAFLLKLPARWPSMCVVMADDPSAANGKPLPQSSERARAHSSISGET